MGGKEKGNAHPPALPVLSPCPSHLLQPPGPARGAGSGLQQAPRVQVSAGGGRAAPLSLRSDAGAGAERGAGRDREVGYTSGLDRVGSGQERGRRVREVGFTSGSDRVWVWVWTGSGGRTKGGGV